ncbi:hypothetical protein SRABI96_05161 [Peribacillus sp. Bi96]|uniref:hypothetical protein n=1 Tax=unclassified Peribacillus TaxID=2675266 RepID=UPI001D46C81A|nr:hypothetical protein [Peribacillus sp. Bi96]CAH0314715.1 hypothetical protein SRABI96_05161 [Peribacillus sp. Bi96]
MFYGLLIMGVALFFLSIFLFISMFIEKEFTFFDTLKALSALIFGGLLLVITLPSLKYMLFKEYDVVNGSCIIEISSSGRSSEASFEMPDTDELFYFEDIPDLDAYGRAVPYYCKVTVTKDHEFEIGYKIYDAKSRELILTSE